MKIEIKAMCLSDFCNGAETRDNARGIIIESARRGDTFCPVCGHALYWSKHGAKPKHFAHNTLWRQTNSSPRTAPCSP